jgi:hypothetical protein
MRFTLALALVLGSLAAQADIPPSPNSKPVFAEIEGEAALALYAAIPGKEIVTAMLRTSSETTKVLRAADGLSQVVCTLSVGNFHGMKSREASCATSRSTNGKALPKYVPVMKMG